MNAAQHKRIASTMALARYLLIAATLTELARFLPFPAFKTPDAFRLLWLLSSVIGIVGFVVAYRTLSALDADIGGDGGAMWGLVGWRGRGSVVMMFLCSFFLPLINVVIFLWAFFKMRGAEQRMVEGLQRDRELAARRNRVMGPGPRR